MGWDAKTLDKDRKVSREALRLLPVEGMPGILVHHEPCAWDSSQEGVLILTGTERIPRAPDNERGGLDLVPLTHKIVLQDSFVSCLPYMCWNLQTLLHDGVQELGGYRLSQRALLELAHEVWIDWISQLGYARLPEV